MKNKKSYLLIILLSLTPLLYSAELTDFSFEDGTGFLNGIIVENVWRAKVIESGNSQTYTPSTRLSRLDWQLNNLPSIFFNTSATFNRHLYINFGLNTSLSGEYGIMEDYDWKIMAEPDHLTNYSIHFLNVKSLTGIKLNLGYKFLFNTKHPLSLTPQFGFEIFTFDFEGVSGYKMYEEDGWAKSYWKRDEVVIEYMQSYFAPRISILLDYDFSRFFEVMLGTGILYCPKYDAYDLHESKSTYYDDKIEGAWNLDGKLGLYFKFKDMNKIGFQANIDYMPDAYAFTYISDNKDSPYSDLPVSGSLGGTAHFLYSYALTYTFYF